MNTSPDRYSELFNKLSESVDNFVKEVNNHNFSKMATDEWTVKDELCHIAGWHEYYAQNYAAQASGTKPFLFVSRGGLTRNQEMVEKLKNKSKKYLIDLLNKAHASLYHSIVIKKVPRMTYIVGTDYATDKFLEMITGHINRHTLLVKRAK